MDGNLKFQKDVPKSFNSKLIDHLLNIRLTLMVKKLVADSISRKELKSIINNEEEKTNDDLINKALDETFEEYFNVKNINDKEKHHFEEQGGSDKGISFVKRGYFKSDLNHDTETNKAA